MADFTKRPCEREAFCRWCDKGIKKGEEMVSGWSIRTSGISIHFCLSCANKIGEMSK
jgi:hypothetical protein